MNAKTELLLYHLLWTAEKLALPTFRNLDQSFEGWAYQSGLSRQIHRLEAKGLLESRKQSFDDSRVLRLTEAGRLSAIGGRDPEQCWAEEWDHKWRLILFDIPESQRSLRLKLTRSLAKAGWGCLQGSVWISPTPATHMEGDLLEEGEDCSHLMTLETNSRGTHVDNQMARAAWDFESINEAYAAHLKVMKEFPAQRSTPTAQELADWAKKENAAWLDAIHLDPLLPQPLLPKGYQGRRAWNKRKSTLAKAGRTAKRLTVLDATE